MKPWTHDVDMIRSMPKPAEVENGDVSDIRTQAVAVVYYIQWADRIKIGTSRNLPERLKALTYDRLLAIEPGSHAVEHMRHVLFAPLRVQGEWFLANPALLAHIDLILARYGDPQRAYVRWITGNTP